MKTVTELLELVSKAIERTNKLFDNTQENKYDVFFIDFYGHVNQISIRYYQVYKTEDENTTVQRCRGYLNNEENIQELYWFLKNRL